MDFETGNDRGFAGAHLHQARRRNGKRHQQGCPAHPAPRKRPGLFRRTVVVMAMMMVMPAVTVSVAAVVVMIVCVRLAQWATPG